MEKRKRKIEQKVNFFLRDNRIEEFIKAHPEFEIRESQYHSFMRYEPIEGGPWIDLWRDSYGAYRFMPRSDETDCEIIAKMMQLHSEGWVDISDAERYAKEELTIALTVCECKELKRLLGEPINKGKTESELIGEMIISYDRMIKNGAWRGK